MGKGYGGRHSGERTARRKMASLTLLIVSGFPAVLVGSRAALRKQLGDTQFLRPAAV